MGGILPKILYSVVYSKGEMFKAKVEEHREQVTALQQQVHVYDEVSGIVIIWVSQAYFSEFPQLV